jgi:hypothetical protein
MSQNVNTKPMYWETRVCVCVRLRDPRSLSVFLDTAIIRIVRVIQKDPPAGHEQGSFRCYKDAKIEDIRQVDDLGVAEKIYLGS